MICGRKIKVHPFPNPCHRKQLPRTGVCDRAEKRNWLVSATCLNNYPVRIQQISLIPVILQGQEAHHQNIVGVFPWRFSDPWDKGTNLAQHGFETEYSFNFPKNEKYRWTRSLSGDDRSFPVFNKNFQEGKYISMGYWVDLLPPQSLFRRKLEKHVMIGLTGLQTS